MELTLNINGVDFHPYAAEEGITFGSVVRVGREVIAADGTRHYAEITKDAINFSAVELRDSTLATLKAALTTNPATVITNVSGTSDTGSFYVSDVTETAKKVVGGSTYYSGFSFRLEER